MPRREVVEVEVFLTYALFLSTFLNIRPSIDGKVVHQLQPRHRKAEPLPLPRRKSRVTCLPAQFGIPPGFLYRIAFEAFVTYWSLNLNGHSPAMVSTSARPRASQNIRDAIAEQFALSQTDLRAITQQFVDDFNHGLSRYNEPMAMMCAIFLLPRLRRRTEGQAKPYVRDGSSAGRFRERVC
jgi:hypothetical protein